MSYVTPANIADFLNKDLTPAGEALATDLIAGAQEVIDRACNRSWSNGASGAFSITLPTAVGITGRQYTVKRINAGVNNVTVACNGAPTVDGAATKTLGSQWGFLVVVSDGENWVIVSQVGTVG